MIACNGFRAMKKVLPRPRGPEQSLRCCRAKKRQLLLKKNALSRDAGPGVTGEIIGLHVRKGWARPMKDGNVEMNRGKSGRLGLC